MSSRDDGFSRADIDVGLLTDPKVRRMARLLPADGDFATAMLVYLSTVLHSWREGRRLPANEAESWVDATDDRIAALQSVGLVDGEGRIPERAWQRWYMEAFRRRENKREGGREGNRRRWGTGEPIGEQSDSEQERSPSDPSQAVTQSVTQAGTPSVTQSGVGDAALRAGSAAASPRTRNGAGRSAGVVYVRCDDYSQHRSSHRQRDGVWTCDRCPETAAEVAYPRPA